MIDFRQILTKVDGTPLQRAKDKSLQQMHEEKLAATSGKSHDEIKREMDLIQIKYAEVENITLGFIACEALLNTLKDDEGISGVEIYDRRKLAKRIFENDQNFTEVEKEKIKKLVERAFWHNAQIVGAVFELFDN